MSDAPAPETADAPKKKSLVKKLIPVIGAVVLLGAAVGGGIYIGSAGLIGGGGGGHGKSAGGHGKSAEASHGEEGEATYVPIETSFTANVRDSDAVMQVAIGVSTRGGESAKEKIKELELPIRSAVLLTLSSAEGDPLLEDAGKRQLAKQLAKAINGVLSEKAGATRVDDVYFTSFLIQ